MIHFSCDICRQEICGSDRDRYVLMMEIRPGSNNWELTEDDLSEDNLEKVSELLKQELMDPSELFDDSTPVRIRYDLCAKCRGKFLKNPFSCQTTATLNFSEN